MSRLRTYLGWIVTAAALVTTLGTGTTAWSAYSFEFGQTNYTVAANGTVAVSVFLRETGTTNLATVGLIAGDFRLLFNDTLRVAQPAQVISRTPNSAFDSPAPTQPAIVAATATTTGNAGIVQSSFDPVLASTATPGLILLGQFTFQVGATAGVVTQLRVVDFDPTADGLVLTNGTVLDTSVGVGTASITVTSPNVVPEPASVALVALAIPPLLLAARRRRLSARVAS